LRFLVSSELPDRGVMLLLQPVQLRLALAGQFGLFVPSPREPLELLLSF
jgi:hypothetical protein